VAWGGGLPKTLTFASTFVLSNGGTNPATAQAMVVGSEPKSGLTHTFLLTSAGATEVHTKVNHYNASAIQSPLSFPSANAFPSILLFGGADEIESFVVPPQSAP
jgi:hypothetical protein